MVKFSTYYRIQERDRFFASFCKRYIKTNDQNLRESMEDTAFELMEIIVKLLLDGNDKDLAEVLAKQNAKHARVFFDYFTGLKTKYMKKNDIVKNVYEFFEKENQEMKDIHSFLMEKTKGIKFEDEPYKPFKLNEAEDDADAGADNAGGDDPFADGGDDTGGDDPFGGDDFGGGDDPFGGDDFGGDSGDSGDGDSEDGDGDNAEDEENKDPYDMEGHEDDPDFTEGADSSDDAVEPNAAGACIYDVDAVMQALNNIIETLPDNQLAEIAAVKKAVTLIFNGKILKAEDVTFNNPKNASFLIKKIGEGLDENTKRYMIIKIKQPLIKLRDQNKEDLAAMKNDNSNIRDTLNKID